MVGDQEPEAYASRQVAALVAVLKEARKLHLLTHLEAAEVEGQSVNISAPLLLRASVHASDMLRIDALHLACVSPKSTSLPGKAPDLAHQQHTQVATVGANLCS